MGKGARLKEERAQAKQKLFDRDMTRIMTRQINKQLAKESDRFYSDEIMVILYVLHTKFGFGEKRLMQFVASYAPACQELREFYDMSEDSTPWICKKRLELDGINLDAVVKAAITPPEEANKIE